MIGVTKDYFAPAKNLRQQAAESFNFASLSAKQLQKLGARLAYCEAVVELRRGGNLTLSHEGIAAAFPHIKLRADAFFNDFVASNYEAGSSRGDTALSLMPKSSTSILKWHKRYQLEGVFGLIDNRWKSGRKGSRLVSEVEDIVQEGISRYLHPDQPTKNHVIRHTQSLFEKENEKRAKLGRPRLPLPAKNTINRRLSQMSPYEVSCNRDGSEVARKKFFPVGTGLQVGRPLERVEMDGWTVDLMTLAKSSGVYHQIAPELVEEMELDGQKVRWHLFAAMCCTTKCIVSLTLSRAEDSSAAIDCMHDIFMDKGQKSDAVDALSPWDMHGTPDLLVTDNGAAFKSNRFILAAQNIGIDFERAPAGLPQMRGNIERLFGTISTNLVGRLSGRTFSDVVEKGEYPSQERAVLTVQDFADLLVKWTVDVYHNTPHTGLTGETPVECWRRLAGEFGVRPGPDIRSRRLAFGVELERKLSREGILILGVHYNSDALVHAFMHSPKRVLKCRWLSQNIGEIEVFLDGVWITVPAVLSEFKDRSAAEWLQTRCLIRNGDPQARRVSNEIVRRAFDDIDRSNSDAGKRAEIVSERWDAEMIERFERNTLIGFKVGSLEQGQTHAQEFGQLVHVPETNKGAQSTQGLHPEIVERPVSQNSWEI